MSSKGDEDPFLPVAERVRVILRTQSHPTTMTAPGKVQMMITLRSMRALLEQEVDKQISAGIFVIGTETTEMVSLSREFTLARRSLRPKPFRQGGGDPSRGKS